MTNFKGLFQKSKNAPLDTIYKGMHVFSADKFIVRNGELLVFSIESSNSKCIQGFSVGVYGNIKIKNKIHKKGRFINMLFWEDTEILDPKHIEIQVFTKEGFIFIQNIWEIDDQRGMKKACSVGSSDWLKAEANGGAMYAENIENGKRYFCNDGKLDDDFDDIIFTVKKVPC